MPGAVVAMMIIPHVQNWRSDLSYELGDNVIPCDQLTTGNGPGPDGTHIEAPLSPLCLLYSELCGTRTNWDLSQLKGPFPS